MLTTKRFTFHSPLHRTSIVMLLLGNLRQETYNLTQDDVDIVHDALCGCNHEPTCELWGQIEYNPDTHYLILTMVGLSVRFASMRIHNDCECPRCGKVYQGKGWSSLPLLGHTGGCNEAQLEMRNCECGTTMSRKVL